MSRWGKTEDGYQCVELTPVCCAPSPRVTKHKSDYPESKPNKSRNQWNPVSQCNSCNRSNSMQHLVSKSARQRVVAWTISSEIYPTVRKRRHRVHRAVYNTVYRWKCPALAHSGWVWLRHSKITNWMPVMLTWRPQKYQCPIWSY